MGGTISAGCGPTRKGDGIREIADQLAEWLAAGRPFGLATVTAVRGSAPKGPGATLAVAEDGEVLGSVSGGCVEGAVVEAVQTVLAGGLPHLVTYGITDEQALSVGLTCGGVIDVFVNGGDAGKAQAWATGLDVALREVPVAVATVVSGPASAGAVLTVEPESTTGSLGREGLDAAVTDDARGMLVSGETGIRHYGSNGERRVDDVAVFIHSFAPRPRMIVFGAIDFASALARMGSFLGYHVTVCDARAAFATTRRFPTADEVVVEWPHRYLSRTTVDARTVLCVLTHDPKFDVPLLEAALQTPACYIGVMGSRRSHDDRLSKLRERGVADDVLRERLRSPVGLDLGGRTPAETAVSIAAEIVAVQWGGSGKPLSLTQGAIHGEPTFARG